MFPQYQFLRCINKLFSNGKTVDAYTLICLSGTQYGRRPSRFVGAVGVMLRFEANTGTGIVDNLSFTLDRTVEEITGIYLYSGLGSAYRKANTRLGRYEPHSRAVDISGRSEYPVMVISVSAVRSFHAYGLLRRFPYGNPSACPPPAGFLR